MDENNLSPIPDFENDPTLTDKQKYRRREYYRNREENIKKSAEWVRKNPSKATETRKKYREEHREEMSAYLRSYYQSVTKGTPMGRRKKRSYSGDYYERNREKIRSSSRARVRAVKREVIDAYGKVCACCAESSIEFLAIDHINGDGFHERQMGMVGSTMYRVLRNAGFPDKDRYRVLCHNCNTAIGTYGYCPHVLPTGFQDGIGKSKARYSRAAKV
jgi:hypothetical protein